MSITEAVCTSRMLFVFVAGALVVQMVVGFSQVNGSKQVFHRGGGSSVDFAPGTSGLQYEELTVPPVRVADVSNPAQRLTFRLPHRVCSYVLNVGIREIDQTHPPRLKVQVNNRLAGGFVATPYYWPEKTHGRDVCEIFIPQSMLNQSSENLVEITTSEGYWKGRLLIIPYGVWRQCLPYTLPLTVCLFLGLLLRQSWVRVDRVMPYAVCAAFFGLYYYSLFTKKMAPIDGFFWDDATDYIGSVISNEYSFKLGKHMLLFPVMHFLWEAVRPLAGRDLFSLAGAFALISAANISVAYLWIRRKTESAAVALCLVLLYGFSFSIWAFASIYESYVFTALIVNLFFLSISFLSVRNRFFRYVLPALLVALSALAHPPMIVLAGILGMVVFFEDSPGVRKAGRIVAVALLCGFFFLGGRLLIRMCYNDPGGGNDAAVTVAGQVDFAHLAMERYAGVENMTWSNAGNVVLGQFAYAVGGFPYAFKWYQGWSGFPKYFASIPGVLFAAGWLVFWVAALAGAFSSKRFLMKTLFCGVFVLLPYMLFYWYFNPHEMLLYAAPLVLPVLGWMVLASRLLLKAHFAKLLVFVVFSTVILNTIVLLSYH